MAGKENIWRNFRHQWSLKQRNTFNRSISFFIHIFSLEKLPQERKGRSWKAGAKAGNLQQATGFSVFRIFYTFCNATLAVIVGGCTRICFIFAGCFVAGDAATKIQLAAQKVLQMRAENLINVDTSWGQNWTELNLVLAEEEKEESRVDWRKPLCLWIFTEKLYIILVKLTFWTHAILLNLNLEKINNCKTFILKKIK